MAARTKLAEAVHFRGWPERLTGAVKLPASGPISLKGTLDLPDESGPPAPFYGQPMGPPIGKESWIRLSLPTTIAPGTYRGTIEVGDQKQAATFEVEPRVNLLVIPDSLVLRGRPGARVTAQLTLVNSGNVAFEVRRAYALGVSDVDGLERAFGETFRAKLPPGERLIDHFANKLAEGHGGLVRVQIANGAGSLAPAESRQLEAVFKLPDRMRPGRIYSGTWPIEHVRYGVQIETTNGVPSDEDEHEAEHGDKKE